MEDLKDGDFIGIGLDRRVYEVTHDLYGFVFDNPKCFIDPYGMGPNDIVISGDVLFRQEAFRDLQALCSTKLVLLDNGTVVQPQCNNQGCISTGGENA